MNLGFLKSTRAAMAAIQQQDHADGCACDACSAEWMNSEATMPDLPGLIHVGLPVLTDQHSGYARAKAVDGEILITVKGFGVGELSMPKAEATALRDQLNNALNQL